MTNRTHSCLLAGLAVLCGAIAPSLLHAQPGTVRGEVFVVLAKEAPGEIDPALADLSALRQPPFNAFRSLSILERQAVRLRQNTPQDINLPNGRVLRLELQRVMPDGRLRVRVSIKREGEDAYLPLLQVVTAPGDPFFVAGQSHQGGTLVIGVRLGSA
jgi:hypothetical protein